MKITIIITIIFGTMGLLSEGKGVKGVNIGGWLVLEPWITPSLFPNEDTIDEWTFCEKTSGAQTKLQTHWKEFATAAHFASIKKAGFNMVRIPIGYWAFAKLDNEPYISGAADYLDQAITWAESNQLTVMIDLHGAPGSQNGFDNSGQKTSSPKFTQKANVDHTLKVLGMISDKYATNPTVDGIAILNEPKPDVLGNGALAAVEDFSNQAISTIKGNVPLLVSDAFQGVKYWEGKFKSGGIGGGGNAAGGNASSSHLIIIDHHTYQVFDDGSLGMSQEDHIKQAGAEAASSASTPTTPVIIGEFSGAMTDCAKYLNGRTEGARWESKFSGGGGLGKSCLAAVNDKDAFAKDKDLVARTKAFVGAQTGGFGSKTNGWFFWNFRTENAPEWDALFLVGIGAFPM